MSRRLAVIHTSTAAALAAVAPLSLIASVPPVGVVIGVAVLAVVISGALARTGTTATVLAFGLLVTYFVYASTAHELLRAVACAGLVAAAVAYACYAALASVVNLSAGGHSL